MVEAQASRYAERQTGGGGELVPGRPEAQKLKVEGTKVWKLCSLLRTTPSLGSHRGSFQLTSDTPLPSAPRSAFLGQGRSTGCGEQRIGVPSYEL